MSVFIPQMEPWFGEEEKEAVVAYLSEGGWITEYQRTSCFEEMIAEYTGAKHCIVVNNGTISLTLAALACGITPGDEVIVPNYTMIATPNSIKLIGGTPIFVDVEHHTLCMDIEQLKKAISPRTKAVILVTANGRYPKSGIEEFNELALRHNISLIEDAAQSLGSRYPNHTHQGCAGVVGSFSFSAPKIISTGQGGCLVTNNDALAIKLRKLKDFGRCGGGNDIHDSVGYNFKFTELQACIGIEQMKKLDWRVNRKKEIYSLYRSLLAEISQISFFDQDIINTTPWFIDVLAENRNGLQGFLLQNGIASRVMYPPINAQKAYGLTGSYPVSEEVGRRGLWLPSAAQLSNSQVEYICSKVSSFYSH